MKNLYLSCVCSWRESYIVAFSCHLGLFVASWHRLSGSAINGRSNAAEMAGWLISARRDLVFVVRDVTVCRRRLG
jgi:hypothetical protein